MQNRTEVQDRGKGEGGNITLSSEAFHTLYFQFHEFLWKLTWPVGGRRKIGRLQLRLLMKTRSGGGTVDQCNSATVQQWIVDSGYYAMQCIGAIVNHCKLPESIKLGKENYFLEEPSCGEVM